MNHEVFDYGIIQDAVAETFSEIYDMSAEEVMKMSQFMFRLSNTIRTHTYNNQDECAHMFEGIGQLMYTQAYHATSDQEQADKYDQCDVSNQPIEQ